MQKFNIGDHAWLARAGQNQIWVTCSECLGSGRLRVILGDNSEVSIECVCCDRGYEGSPGKRQTYSFVSEAHVVIITGLEANVRGETIHIRYSSACYHLEEENLFATREEAEARALVLVQEHEAEEAKRLRYKEKDHKTWAWNVSYWRREIRDAQKVIERAQARLNVAPHNPKEADKLASEATS